MSESSPSSDHKWNADRPLERIEDDALSRAQFAERVAKEISGWRTKKDSLVISLNGEWGSGKTSLKAFIKTCIIAHCETAKIPTPAVVEFNPWQWSGQNRLLEAFFDEIGAVFRNGKVDSKATSEKLARFWEGLKVVTIATREVATQVRESVVAAAALLAGSSGIAATIVKSPLAQAFWSIAGLFFIGLSALCGTVPAVADALAAAFKWKSEKKKPTLDEVRAKLQTGLADIKAPVVVVIDDIDRLTKREVRLLMQLVKANANFPNVVYLLLYQKDIVAGALNSVASENGADFLKKIVQIELEVPAAPEHKLREIFSAGLDRIWKRGEFRWDLDQHERFRKLFQDAVWPYFGTPRDVKRFLGVYEFYYEGHLNDGVLEINPVDLLLVETLRMFDQEAVEEEAELQVALKRATSAAKKLLRGGNVEDAEKAAAEVLIAEGFPRQDARKEARLIVSETLGVLDGEREMKNAENRAQRAGRKACDGSRKNGEDVIACRQKARAAILASFESAGMGFDPQAPVVVRLLDKIVPSNG